MRRTEEVERSLISVVAIFVVNDRPGILASERELERKTARPYGDGRNQDEAKTEPAASAAFEFGVIENEEADKKST